MKPKSALSFLLILIISATTFAQTKNPFASIGKKGKILTLTKGAYDETFDNDSIQQIGSSLINVHTMKVVKLLTDEESKKRLESEKHSRFLSVDPLTSSYPMLTPYQFASNRPIDGVDMDGLEYVKRIHTVDSKGQVIFTTDILYYQMTDQRLRVHGGTTKGLYNSAGYGPEGKGIKHEYYLANGEKYQEPIWDLSQNSFMGSLSSHGLYSGDGSITKTGQKDYDFSWKPIDAADAIAKRHDMNYSSVHAYDVVEDNRTLFADKQMVNEDKDFLESVPLRLIFGGRVAGETIVAAESQQKFIGILADYKEWKRGYLIENHLDPNNIDDNKKVFLSNWRVKFAYINSDKERRKERSANLVILLGAKSETNEKKK